MDFTTNRNLVFVTDLNFLIPDDGNPLYFKLRIFDLIEFIV